MPRYFLHIDDGTQHIEDEEGSDHPDLSAAREEALDAARQLWAAAIMQQRDLGPRRFLIANDEGQVVDTVAMDAALPPALIERLAS